jgi:dedicator of cytokinesis protein 3
MTLETCLRLHGRVCPPEMLPFHETLEAFFRKNFAAEIRRLAAEGLSDFDYAGSLTPSTAASQQDLLGGAYPASSQTHSARHSLSSVATSRAPYTLPALQLGASVPSLASPRDSVADGRPTPLKRHLQHLAKHGLGGVGGTGQRTPTDAASPASPGGSGSVINVVPPPAAAPAAAAIASGANSLRSRLSRLGNSIRGRD